MDPYFFDASYIFRLVAIRGRAAMIFSWWACVKLSVTMPASLPGCEPKRPPRSDYEFLTSCLPYQSTLRYCLPTR